MGVVQWSPGKGIVVKFNGGDPVVLCSKCRVILRKSVRDRDYYLPAQFCKKCSK